MATSKLTNSGMLQEAFNSDLSNIEYGVTILARDGETLFVHVRGTSHHYCQQACPCLISAHTASVNEDIGMDTPILSINATSPEGQGIIYIIIDGDLYKQFNIDFDTGVLKVISPLDYEMTSVYKLTVRASDALTGARAEVTIDLLVNDV